MKGSSRFPAVFYAVATAIGLAGCAATPQHVQQAKAEIITNDNNNRQLLSAEHVKQMADDVEGLKAQLNAANEADAKIAAALAEEKKRIEEASFKLKDLGELLVAGLGTAGQIASGNYGGAIKTVSETAANLAKKAAVEESQALIAAASDKQKLALDALNTSLREKVENSETMTKEKVATVENRVAMMNSELTAKLTGLDATTKDHLAKLARLDPDQMKSAFLEAAAKQGVSKAEIEALKTLTPTEILTLLGLVGVGAAGSGTLLTRRGRANTDEKVAKVEESLGFGRAKPYMDEVFEQLDDIKTRVGILSKTATPVKPQG